MVNNMFGIKTDLDLTGISMGFASVGRSALVATAEDVSKGSYERPDALVLLSCGSTLHAVLVGGNDIKLTILDAGKSQDSKPLEIGWVNVETMRNAVETGVLNVGLQTFRFTTTRLLKRLLAKAKK